MTTADRMRTVVKLAGSISLGASARRHRIEFAEKQSRAMLVSAAVRTMCLASAPLRDVLGEPVGILPDAGQERGVHPRQPLQADEVEARHVGDAVTVDWLSLGVQDRLVDPAEVAAVARAPDHRADAARAKIETAQRIAHL